MFVLGPSQPQRGLSADSPTPRLLLVCPRPSSISHVRLIAGTVSGHLRIDETTEYPESLCPMSVLPPLERRGPFSSEGVTPPSSLLRTHAPIPSPLPNFGLSLVRGVFAGCYQPLLLTVG